MWVASLLFESIVRISAVCCYVGSLVIFDKKKKNYLNKVLYDAEIDGKVISCNKNTDDNKYKVISEYEVNFVVYRNVYQSKYEIKEGSLIRVKYLSLDPRYSKFLYSISESNYVCPKCGKVSDITNVYCKKCSYVFNSAELLRNKGKYLFNIRLIDFYLDYFDDNYPSIFFLINVILLTLIFGVLFIVGGFL